jgi:2-polyprenyl-3-methyl-5-hydroxy-6-metoxy-1,4-benzoquinol methylase
MVRDAVVERFWHLARLVKPVRERVTLGELNDHVEREHEARYRFAMRYCAGKSVADIACGTGYGSRILGEVATSVDGYDRQELCGNRVLDLERQSWDKKYDVIVSFETIEHLENPEFFLENAHRTAGLLIVSTPIGESRGYNPYHKQVWELQEFLNILDLRFRYEVFHQHGPNVLPRPEGVTRFVIAVCTPK